MSFKSLEGMDKLDRLSLNFTREDSDLLFPLLHTNLLPKHGILQKVRKCFSEDKFVPLRIALTLKWMQKILRKRFAFPLGALIPLKALDSACPE